MEIILNSISIDEFKKIVADAVEERFQAQGMKKQACQDIEYLTRKETAAKLHISLPTLNEYTKSGKLKGYRLNGRVLYRKDEINTALTAIEPLKYRRS